MVVWPDQVYISFYGRFHIQMCKKACLRCKEHFNLLILGSLPTGFLVQIPGSFLAEYPVKFPIHTYNSHKKHQNFSKNIEVRSENNFKNREACFVCAPNISYFSLKPLLYN
jgi:hypothetical protein